MKSMTQCTGKELVWSQPKMSKREFELHDGADLVATLKWHRSSGSLATGVAFASSWTLKRAGFLRPRVVVRNVDSAENMAQFEAGWAGGGRLFLSNGHGYFWRQRSFWRNEWAFEDEQGRVVVQFRADVFILKRTVQLTVVDVNGDGPYGSLLAVLGLYLMVLSHDDSLATLTIVAS